MSDFLAYRRIARKRLRETASYVPPTEQLNPT